MKKIAVGDLGEFWYGDYKEPFEQLEGAVTGYPQGVVLKDDDGRLLCAFCGRTFHNLGGHTKRKHGMTGPEYKREVGLLQGSALVSEKIRWSMAAKATRQWATMPPSSADRLRALNRDRKTRLKSVAGMNASKFTSEGLNKTGRCYAQALEVARQVAREGPLVQTKLDKRGISWKRVRLYFGNIENLRRLIGNGWGSGLRRWTDAELLSAISSIAKEVGRTPGASDLKRFGVPDPTIYNRRFGSYIEACRRAGLEPNLPKPLSSETDLRALVAFAVSGDERRAADAAGLSSHQVVAVLHRYGFPFPVRGYRGEGAREWAADMARRLAGDTIAA
jgi:hypothetical protein